MQKTIWNLLIGIILIGAAAVRAEESRIWTDKHGNTVEAKYVDVMGKKVILEKADGSRITVLKAGLCASDQKYLAGAILPELKIKVDKDADSRKVSEGYSYTEKKDTYTLKVTITKMNEDKCTRKFAANLYMVAKSVHGSGRKVMCFKGHSFLFDKRNTISFDATSSVRNEDWWGGKEGWQYEGYLLVVEDEGGKIIAMDSSKGSYEKNAALLKDHKGGKEFRM